MLSVETLPRTSRKPAVRGVLALFAVLLVLIGVAVVVGVRPRLSRQKTLLAASRADNVHLPVVNVAKVERSAGTNSLELPGDLMALNEAPIYARADGYLKQRLVDIGFKVKRGQLLGELDTPELDQQIHQAEATLSQSNAAVKQFDASLLRAKANLQLAQVTLERWKRLGQKGAVSRQEEDEKQANHDVLKADVAAAEANLAAQKNVVAVNEANLKRLGEMKSFARIVSPFDGVVTERNVDVGTLISAGSAGRQMFRVAQINPLRIFVNVPQAFVEPVRAVSGEPARLAVQQLPGRVFQAHVTLTNAALDPNSRTMLAVLEVPNPRGELLPGMFANVKFQLSGTYKPLVVPGDTILSKPGGPTVAVVGGDGKVRMRRIDPGRDFGSRMEVLSGVSEGELLVVNATDDIREGVQVQVRRGTP